MQVGAPLCVSGTARGAAALKQAGIPLYPGAVPITGGMGISFATADVLQKVRDWYLKKQTDWSLFKDGGMWVLYKGKPGLNPMEIFKKHRYWSAGMQICLLYIR